MRATIAREWTDREAIYAARLSDAAGRRTRALPDAYALLRAARLPVTAAERDRLYDRSALAGILHPDRFPGRAFVHHPTRGYLSTDDDLLVIESILPAMKRVHTILTRQQAAASILDASTLRGSMIRSHIGAGLLAVGPGVWDALIADVAAGR